MQHSLPKLEPLMVIGTLVRRRCIRQWILLPIQPTGKSNRHRPWQWHHTHIRHWKPKAHYHHMPCAQIGHASCHINQVISFIRWKPSEDIKQLNLFLNVNAENEICFWDAATGKNISRRKEIDDNSLACVDYNKAGSKFACAGKEKAIRIYEEEAMSYIMELKPSNGIEKSGHLGRIFSVKFSDENPNLLISGGWDSNVMIWDLREASAVGSFSGPHICGESIDVRGDAILTGSYGSKTPIEVWSLKMMKLIDQISWTPLSKDADMLFVYSAKFSPNGKYIVAGSSGKNEMKVFKFESNLTNVATVPLDQPVSSVDYGKNNKIACLTADGTLRLFNMKEQ